MDRKEERVIERILQYANSILDYSCNINTVEEIEKDSMLIEAICFDIIQIGELVRDGLSNETKQNIRKVPWHQINGLRNRVVHGYNSIKLDVVFETIKKDVPELKEELENYMANN